MADSGIDAIAYPCIDIKAQNFKSGFSGDHRQGQAHIPKADDA
jgi:hypothetical protein